MIRLTAYRPGLWLTELRLDDIEMEVRGVVIAGAERVVVWDTLTHPRDMAPVTPLLAGRPVTVVYSHADWDHAWGTAGLLYDEVIGHEICRERFAADVPATLARMQADEPGRWDEVRLIPPTRTFREELILPLGGVSLHLHYLPGHTRDCIAGFIPKWGIWLGGDTVEDPLPLLEETSPLELWLARLRAWVGDERVQTVIPAHGPVGGRELIRRNIAYLAGLRDGTGPVPAPLPDFYREAHAANLRYSETGAARP